MRRSFTIIIILFLLYATSFLIAKNLEETPLTSKIAIIPIQGAITVGNHESLYQASTASSNTIVSYLDSANKDKSIKAILLEINSPGGTAVASAEIAAKIKSIDKPVVAFIREVGASGGYWIASAADKIVANPLSITGSIGVISSYLEFSGLMEEYGIGYEQLMAGEYKDMGTPFRGLTEKEKSIMQSKLNIIHNEFIKAVNENRNIDLSQYATGMFYLGLEAKEIGLIDETGDRELAINITKQLANIKEAELITYREPENILNFLQKLTSEFGLNIGRGISSTLVEQQTKILA
jgi:protease-4